MQDTRVWCSKVQTCINMYLVCMSEYMCRYTQNLSVLLCMLCMYAHTHVVGFEVALEFVKRSSIKGASAAQERTIHTAHTLHTWGQLPENCARVS